MPSDFLDPPHAIVCQTGVRATSDPFPSRQNQTGRQAESTKSDETRSWKVNQCLLQVSSDANVLFRAAWGLLPSRTYSNTHFL